MKNILLVIFTIISVSTKAQSVLIQKIIPSAAQFYPVPSMIKYRNDLHIDAIGNYWIAFEKGGLAKYDGGTGWTKFDSAGGAFPVNKINCIASDGSGNVFAGTSAGLSYYNGTWNPFPGFPGTDVTAIEIRGTDLWIGTNNGIYYKEFILPWVNFNHLTPGFVNDSITCITSGNNGEIWVGTKHGISKYNLGSWTPYTTALVNQQIEDLEVNGNNELWIGDAAGNIYFKNSSGIFIDLNTIFPQSTQHCSYFPNPTMSSHLKRNGNDILVTFDNTSKYINGREILLAINPLHQLSYISFGTLLSPISQYYFDYKNGKFALLRSYATSAYSNFYTCDLTSVSFAPLTETGDSSNLNINQVNSRINNDGEMHWDPNDNSSGIFEMPACSRKNTVYASALWVGGYDQSNQLHTAAQTYKQVGSTDFWPGPLDTINASTNSTTTAQYDRLWKINKTDIDTFIINSITPIPGYLIPQVILDWPAAGTGNYSRSLAPFVDANNNGFYEPLNGDYPKIDGDQELWWIFNDSFAAHTETNGLAFGFEIQAKAYAFNCDAPTPDNEVINYTQFYQYKIINRSNKTYHDIYLGLWSDIDLGDASDDYVGCDVGIHTGFGYNGDNDDQGSFGYGLNPPYQNIAVLKGPLANPLDGIDNNYNGTIDEPGECNSLNHFTYYQNTNGVFNGNPGQTDDYYEYMSGFWANGVQFTYGGNGAGGGPGATSTPCDFQYPGNTDPAFTTNWTMPIGGIAKGDVRMILSSGKFSIAPGETRTIDFAYITTRDTVTFPNFTYNHNEVAKVQYWFDNNLLSSCPPPVPISILESNNSVEQLIIRPNPARDLITLQNVKTENDYIYSISDVTGKTFNQSKLLKKEIDISRLSPGLYIIRIENKNEIKVAKFVKLQ